MTNEEIKSKLREVVNTPARQITEEQKAAVITISADLGVKISPKRNCGSCWHDAAMKILQHMEQSETGKSKDDNRKYVLKNGVDLLFGSLRINEFTLTDDLARYIISRGFETKYFEKCE